MKKYLIRITVAFLTFSLGILAAALFASRYSIPEEEFRHVVTIRPRHATHRHVNEAWRRIELGRVSFSIPADLEKTGPPGNAGVIEAFAGRGLYVNYSYGPTVSSDFNVRTGNPSDLTIDGKPAKLYVNEFDRRMLMNLKDLPLMQLVVPDVGDGRTKFEIYAAGFDVDLMKQIMESVQIR